LNLGLTEGVGTCVADAVVAAGADLGKLCASHNEQAHNSQHLAFLSRGRDVY
jgi:hypothetical protein